jgi:hypothetical protein
MPLNASRHNSFHVMSLFTVSHANTHQIIYLFMSSLIFLTNSMLYLRVARYKIIAVEIHVGSVIQEWFSQQI